MGFFNLKKNHNSQTTRDRDLKFAIRVDPEVCAWGGASKSGHWIWVPTLEAHNSETNRAIGLKFCGHTDLDPS